MKRKHRLNLTDDSGLTLIELMVVIVILGVLAGLIMPNIMKAPDEARQGAAVSDMHAIGSALKMYKLHNGSYPTTEQGLEALVEAPASGGSTNKWKGPYLERFPKDPWDNMYIYLSPGVHGDYDLMSYGADGVQDGDGFDADIKSWDNK
ncbi:type II secretion system major pseudopilin GspG [Desulfobacterales bacterium HSG16]|nr:type II secretion system major pseudopilin GspG [Desulfobacterales bacterium HSG16]